MRATTLLLPLLLLYPAAAGATPARVLQEAIGYEQQVGARVPPDLAFTDHAGRPVRIGDLVTGRPAIVVFAWYDCDTLCGPELRALAEAVAGLRFRLGDDYRVVTVGIDPTEGRSDAAASRNAMLSIAGQPGNEGWTALVGQQPEIAALASAFGFHYARDDATGDYAHPIGLALTAPDGRVSRYLFGMRFPVNDLRLALVEAGRGELGTVIDQIALRCHRFDPATGRYSLAVMGLLQAAGGGTAALLLGVVGWWWWREREAGSSGDGRNG